MMTEDRLRELLRDPGWSLPAWPDAQARVRRAARRQRMALARVTAAVTTVITTAAVVPVLLLSGPAAGFRSAADSWPTADPLALPPAGAVGFPRAIYPVPVQARAVASWLSLCPSAAGLQTPDQDVAFASQGVLRRLTPPIVSFTMLQRAGAAAQLTAQSLRRTLADDLSISDRALWPRLASAGGSGITEVIQDVRSLPVIYSGPLRSYHPAKGSWSLASVVAAGCGSRIVRDTWLVISGHPASPARAAETFFLKRRGHLLLYNVTSRPA
jgi:hypothetical protein